MQHLNKHKAWFCQIYVHLRINFNLQSVKDIQKVKCVLVGSGAVGKQFMAVRYVEDKYEDVYFSVTFDEHCKEILVDGCQIKLSIFKTPGREDYDRTRPLAYPETDVFVVCFAINSPFSLELVTSTWVPEIKYHCNKTRLILVGTKSDTRHDENAIGDLSSKKHAPVVYEEGLKVCKEIQAEKYLECSAKTGEGVNEVFQETIRVAIDFRSSQKRKCCVS